MSSINEKASGRPQKFVPPHKKFAMKKAAEEMARQAALSGHGSGEQKMEAVTETTVEMKKAIEAKKGAVKGAQVKKGEEIKEVKGGVKKEYKLGQVKAVASSLGDDWEGIDAEDAEDNWELLTKGDLGKRRFEKHGF